MTPEQTALVKAFVLADPVLSVNASKSEFSQIANALSNPWTTPTKAWNPNADPATFDNAPDYSVYDSLAAGKRDSWAMLVTRPRDFTMSLTRKWVTDIWGNATAGSNSEKILLAATVLATGAEVAVGGTLRTTGTVSAINRNYIGGMSVGEVNAMLST